MDHYLGEIRMFGFDFAPMGWARADGSLVPIHQNEALFRLLGTQYGGDGTTNFALPDLKGHGAINPDQGAGPSLHFCIAMQGLFPPQM